MNVTVTGASGFLGRAVVARAVAVGHSVTAMLGPHGEAGAFDPAVRTVRCDLRERGDWSDVVASSDVVIHCAAAPGGDRSRQLASTLVGTENLLKAMHGRPIQRLVHISSFSVYDYHALRRGARMDETSALETSPNQRDAYTEAKLAQEALVRSWCTDRSMPCVILRPGAIVGPGKTWGYGSEFDLGPLSVVLAPRSVFRLVSLDNCAEAIVAAVSAPIDGVITLNVVDDDLPTNAEFFRMCRADGAPTGIMLPIPWIVLDALGRLLDLSSKHLLGSRLRTPEILDHRRQEARWKPLRYPNESATRVLGWTSSQDIEHAVRAAVVGSEPNVRV